VTKIEVVADFLCNGLEGYSEAEAADYLFEELGIAKQIGHDLVRDYLAKYSAIPTVPNSELFPFIEKYI